jgi:signal transduction histidine kinase
MDNDRKEDEAKAFYQKILEAENEIEQATSKLFRLENILEDICQEIQSSLGFDFAGISLVSLERNTIEALHGIGIAQKWSGRVKHYLETDKNLRDIQADIVQTRRTEIISGYDKRFDRWIYEEFKHDRVIRVYTPILLLQDKDGNIIEDWFEKYQLQNISTEENLEGKRTVFQKPSFPKEYKIRTIGTVEAGYKDCNNQIDNEQVFNLVELVSRKALDIWKAQLPWVLKIIAEKAMQIMNADSTTLHFLYQPIENKYIHEVFSGRVGWHFLKDCPPSLDGIGRTAIREGKCQYIPDPSKGHDVLEIKKLNKKAFKAGVRALAAFPLQVECQDKIPCQEEVLCKAGILCQEGVLYVGFQQEHQFNEEELRWGQLFANRAADAMRHATIYEQRRDRESLLTTLHSVAQSLADVSKNKDLLRRIAWDTLNILAADVVITYEYIQTENDFPFPPEIAGRLKNEEGMKNRVDPHNVPFLCVQREKNSYVPNLSEDEIFRDAPFAQRENIQSVASILLKVGEEVVGVMFVNYRRSQDFNDKEKKQIIETLASSAAIAIKNQRWLKVRSEIDRKIITTLDRNELLNLIVERAVMLTGADLSTIRLLDPDPSQEMLVTQAKYPKDSLIDESRIRTSINEGITGWVARHRQSALVEDVKSVQWEKYYRACCPNICSELCVPLLDKDGYLLGVLNVESPQIRAFDEKHQQILEALADQAVIGIQNVENRDRLVNMEAMATLGQLAGFLTHKMNNDVGAIRRFARSIFDQIVSEKDKDALDKIIQIAEQIIQEVNRMKNFIQDKSYPTDLLQVIISACDRVNCPDNVTLNVPQKQENLWHVLANEQPLTLVFDNLLNNALDAMPKGGTLSIHINTLESMESDGKIWVQVQVCDTGKGIAKKHKDKIFEIGYTTKTTAKGIKGMGWGLWLTNSYIKRLGGSLTVDSKLRQGTQFTVKLPVYKPKT